MACFFRNPLKNILDLEYLSYLISNGEYLSPKPPIYRLFFSLLDIIRYIDIE